MIEHTTIHNILTWIIAVILFIFQSLNNFIAWIKKYVKHGEKTTTIVTGDTTISSESNTNNNKAPGNVITVQELIQKHFDIPLIIAEDEPKVYNFIKSAQLLTSNEIYKEKKKIDQFMENLVDDSYVARGLGLITATVGRQSEFYLYSKYNNNFENIVIRLSGRNGEIGEITILSENPANIVETKTIPIDYFYDKDRIKVTYTPFAEGVYTLTLVRNSLSICRSPYYISVEKSPTNSRSQIRLGTKKYKPVAKFAKVKSSPLETCDNSLPAIENSKPPISRNILPASEEHSTRTDVMSMVTKFESNSINFQKKVHKRTSSISEKNSETNFIDEISKYSNIQPKIETDDVSNVNVSDLDSPSVQSKSKSTDENFKNYVDITNKNIKAYDMNAINFEIQRIKKPLTKVNENIKIIKDIPLVKNVSSIHLKPTNSVLVESLTDENSHDIEIHNQTIKTNEVISKNNHVETILDPTTKIEESEIKCIDNGPCLQNEVSCFDDDDRKIVVAMKNNNESPSNANDTVIQQITDSAQYNFKNHLESVITKIANSVCEKCSLQVLKIISEFPRDINITHNNNSNEMHSSFESLLAHPISINVNMDNMFEHHISATNEHNSENLLNNNSTVKIKRLSTTDKNLKCHYLNEIEPINKNSDELCGDISNISSEFVIKHNEHNSEISKAINDKIVDHCTIPFAKNTMDKHKTIAQKNELSSDEIMKIKCSETENVLHLNQLNNNTTHKSDNEIGIQGRHLQKSSGHNMDLTKTAQFHKNNISKENDKPLDTIDLVKFSDNKNPNEEVGLDEFKINHVFIPDEHTNIQMSVINNTVLASMMVPLETLEYTSKNDEEQRNIMSNKNVTVTSILNKNQKLMIGQSIEPLPTSFKNKIIEKITQLYSNKTLPNTDSTTILETHDKHLINNSQEIQINDIANNTEINTKYIETFTSQLKTHIEKNKISEIILDRKKIDNNHLFENVENLIKTNINSNNTHTQTPPEIKLQTLVNTTMNHLNNQQIDNEFMEMNIDNETQDVEIKKINNDNIVQDTEVMLAEKPSSTIIENTDKPISSKNKVTVKTQGEIPLVNNYDSIRIDNTNTDIKQRMQLINANENEKIIEGNVMGKKVLPSFQKSHNTVIITPTSELQSTLETQTTNNSELAKIDEYSLKEIQTTIKIIASNISEETDVVKNINNKEEYESVKLQITENVIIKIPHMVEKKTINEIVENISTNTPIKSNSTESLSMQQTIKHEIESLESKIVFDANDVIIKREIIYQSKPINIIQNIVIHKPNPQIITVLNAQVSKNAAKVTLGINTSFLESTTVIGAPSESDLKLDEILIGKEAEISSFINTSITSLVQKIVVEFVTNKDKKQIEALVNIVQKPIKDNIVNAKVSKINSIPEVMDEPVNTKNDVSVTYYINANDNDNVMNTEQINEKEHPSPINSLKEIDRLNITIPIKLNIEVSKEVVDESFANFSTVTVGVQTDVEKVIEEESPLPINYLGEIEQGNMNMSINTKTKTILPIESIIECIDEPEIVYGNTKTEILSCNESLIEIMNHQNDSEKIVDKESINTLGEAVRKNMDFNIDTHNETFLPNESMIKTKLKEDTTVTVITSCNDSLNVILDDKKEILNFIEDKSLTNTNSLDKVVDNNIKKLNIDMETETHVTTESVVETKTVENITETEISTCTDSSILIVDTQTDVDKELDEVTPASINTSDEVVEKKTNINIDTKNTKLLPIETSSSTAKEVIVIEWTNENLLPIESTIHSISKPKILENITETYITSSTESLTKMNNDQNHTVKNINPETFVENHSPYEEVGRNINVKIDTENEKMLATESTLEPIKVLKGLEDIAEAQIPTFTDSFIVTVDAPINVDKERDEFTPIHIDSSDPVVEEKNIIYTNNEKETLLPIKISTDSGEEMRMEEKKTEDLLQLESTIESIKEPTEEKDLTETEIFESIDSPSVTADVQINKDNVIDEVTLIPLHSSDEAMEEKTIINTDTEKEILLPITTSTGSKKENIIAMQKTEEILLPIKSTVESIENSTAIENTPETKITTCTEKCITIVDAPINVDKERDEFTPIHIDSSDQVVEEKNIINTNNEKETLLPIKISTDSGEEMRMEEKKTEDLLQLESTIESIKEPTEEKDLTETEIFTSIDSPSVTVDVQINKDNVIDEVTLIPLHSSDEAMEEKTIINTDTEKEILLPITTSTGSKKENIIAMQKTEEILLPIKSTVESIENSTAIENTPETKIPTCTEKCIAIVDAPINVDKERDEFTPIHNDSSDQVVKEKNIINTNNEKETLLPIKISTDSGEEMRMEEKKTEDLLQLESTIESIEEPTEEKDLTETEIFTSIDSPIVTADVQIDKDNEIDEVTLVPLHSSDEAMEEKTIINTDTEKQILLPITTSTGSKKENIIEMQKTEEILLPIESTVESIENSTAIENTPETKIPTCTEKCIAIVDAPINVDKERDEFTPIHIDSSDQVVEEKNIINTNNEKETLLPIKISTDSGEEMRMEEKKTEDLLQIESTVESMDEPTVVEVEAKILKDITANEITSCTEFTSATVDNQANEYMHNEEEFLESIYSTDENFGECMNVNIDKEKETVFLPDISTASEEEYKKIDKLIETLLLAESTIQEPMAIENKSEAEISKFTDSSTVLADAQINVDNEVEEGTIVPINSSIESTEEKTIINTDTDKEILLPIKTFTDSEKEIIAIQKTTENLLPIKSTVESMDQPTVVEDITETERLCTKIYSNEIIDNKNYIVKIDEQENPVENNSSDEVVGENKNLNIVKENETLLPTKSVLEAELESNMVEDVTVTEILTFADSPIVIVDNQTNIDEEHDEYTPARIHSSDEEKTVKKPFINIYIEKEIFLPIHTLAGSEEEIIIIEKTKDISLPIELTTKSIENSTAIEDTTETEIPTCTEQFIATVDASINVNEERDEFTPIIHIDSSDQVVEEKIITNPNTKKETLLPIKISTASGEEMRVEEKKTEDLLQLESTIESIEEPTEEKDLTETEIFESIDSPIVTADVQIDKDNEIDEVTLVPLHSSDEAMEEKTIINTDTEKQILLPITTSTGSKKENIIEMQKTEEILLPIESTVESIENSTAIENTPETKIPTCTEKCIAIVDAPINVDKERDEFTPIHIDSSDQVVEEKNIINTNNEKETLLPIKISTDSGEEMRMEEKKTEDLLQTESIKKPTEEKDSTETEIFTSTDSPILTKDVQINKDNEIDEVTLVPLNSSVEAMEEKTIINTDTEKEILISFKKCINSREPMIVVDEKTEDLLQIESTVESMDEPTVIEVEAKILKDITANEITSCTEFTSATVDNQANEDMHNEEEFLESIYSTDENFGKCMNVNIDKEKETVFLPDISTASEEEYKKIDKLIETLLLAESTIKEPIAVEHKSEAEISIFTESSTEIIDDQSRIEKMIGQDSPVKSNSSGDVVKDSMNVNIETENETILPIELNKESKSEEDITVNTVISCTDSSNITLNAQRDVQQVIEEKASAPIETLSLIDNLTDSVKEQIIEKNTENKNPIVNYSLAEVVDQELYVKIDTDNQLLPINSSSSTVDDQIIKFFIENEIQIPNYCLVDIAEEQIQTNIKNNNETNTPIDIFTSVEEQSNVKYSSEIKQIANIDSMVQNQAKTENKTLLSIDNYTESVKKQIQVEVMKNESVILIDHSITHDVASLEEPDVVKNSTTAMISSVTAAEEQKAVNAAEVVTGSCDESLDKKIFKKCTRDKTPTSINILPVAVKKQTDIEKVTENKIPILIDTISESVDKQIKIEKATENEATTLITCESEPKVETNEFEVKSGSETSILVNYSAAIAMEQTEEDNLTKRTLANYDNTYRNSKTNLIDKEIKTENLDSSNKCYLKFGETSKMHRLENEDNLQKKSYGIQKLEMSVQRMKTSNEDYYEKTFVQLEQSEKISNIDDENKTIIDDKLYTVNESDLNAILCASSLEEALTLLDSKIKFKFKHKKSSSKIRSTEYIPKIQTSDSKNNCVNTNFTDAREFFKEIEKKSKK